MKKSIVIIFLAALIFAACTSRPKSYIVKGVVSDALYNNQMVYMYDYETCKNTDSALVVDGKFKFAGLVDNPVICQLVLNQLCVNFILEKGKIFVDMEVPKNVKGTSMNNKLSKYRAEIAVLEKEELWGKIEEIKFLDNTIRRKHYDEILEQYRKKVIPVCTKYFNANKNNVFGAYILWNSPISWMPDILDSLYAQADDAVQQYKPLKNYVNTNAARDKKTSVGMPFTNFTIENGNIDGSEASLSDYVGKGKYVLVDFWNARCQPCIAEIPVLVETYNKYKGDRFEMLGVAVWHVVTREENLQAIEKHQIPYPNILDAGDIPDRLYRYSGIPHIILFGPDGKIVARGLRGNQLKAKIAEVMQ